MQVLSLEYHGKVEITAQVGRREQLTIEAGTAVTADFIGRIKAHPLAAHSFTRQLPQKLPCLHWSFDTLHHGQNSEHFDVKGEHPLIGDLLTTYHATHAPLGEDRMVKGRHGNGLRFLQQGDSVSTNYPGVGGTAPRTIAVWLRIPPENYQKPEVRNGSWYSVLGWGLRHHPNYNFTESIQVVIGAPKIGQSSHPPKLVPILSFEGLWLEGETHLGDGAWHHVIWVFDGTIGKDGIPKVTCYCDGKPEPLRGGGSKNETRRSSASSIDTVINTDQSFPLTIGGSLLSATKGKEPPAPSEIDELFIIEGVVSPEEAQILYRQNRYQPAPAVREILKSDE